MGLNEFADMPAEEFAAGFLVKDGLEEAKEASSLEDRVDSLVQVADGYSGKEDT